MQKMERTRNGRAHVRFYVTVPKTLVEALGWEKGDELVFRLVDHKLIMERPAP